MKSMSYQQFADLFDVYFTKDVSGCWNCWCKIPSFIDGTWTEDKAYEVELDDKLILNIDDLKEGTIYFHQPHVNDLVFVWNDDNQIANIRRYKEKYVGYKNYTVYTYNDSSYTEDYDYCCLFSVIDAGKTGGQLKIERGM